MRIPSNVIWFALIQSLLLLTLPALAKADKKLQFDAQGDMRYSHYNFTDIKTPYDGADGWMELKGLIGSIKTRLFLHISVSYLYLQQRTNFGGKKMYK